MKSNYIKLLGIIIVTVLITIIISNVYRNSEGNKNNSSYIVKYVSNISYPELKNLSMELSSNTYIYLSYIGNKDIYDMEKQIRKILKKNDLEESFIYVDCTSYINDQKTIPSLKELFTINNKNITLPAIIYFKDNNPVDYIDSSISILTADKFYQLLDKYEIKDLK